MIYHLLVLTLASLLLGFNSYAKEPSLDDLQSVMVFKVIQLTEWPQEKRSNPINIGVYGATSAYISILNKHYNQRPIRDRQLIVKHYNPFSDNSDIQVLIIKNKYVTKLTSISKLIKNKNILLISEGSTDTKHLMVNLSTTEDGKLGFEINRANILLANLIISKDIVMAGGSELDVAMIFDQAVTDLSKAQSELSEKESELAQKSIQLSGQKQQILELAEAISIHQIKLAKQDKQIWEKDSELKQKEIKLTNLKSNLDTQIKIIDSSTLVLENIEKKLTLSSDSLVKQEVKNLTLADKIKANIKTLEEQKEKLTIKDIELKNKEDLLSKADQKASQQETTIETQKQFLIVSIIIGLLFISLIIALYRIYSAKKKSSSLLEKKNQQLQHTMNHLHQTQEQLIESEKMASLGVMVAGIAHEINTPVGIVLTADSSLLEHTSSLQKQMNANTITKKDLENYLEYSIQCNTLSVENIQRVASLIKTFKLVAVDQTSIDLSEFNLSTYLDELLLSMQYLITGTEHKIEINRPDILIIKSYPTVYMQIIHTLITNSLIHGLDKMKHGKMELNFSIKGDQLLFSYKDNGKGASNEVIEKIFDPFYTTTRGSGGSGLGTHILYNMVTQLLKGTVSCKQNSPQGLIFDFVLPLDIFSNHSFDDSNLSN